jgi:predicted O-methyltransferase YrrM
MRRLVAAALLVAVGLAVTAQAQSQAQSQGTVTPEMTRLLTAIRAADTGQLAVSEEDGRFLRVFIAAQGAKRILEIGGASGYSGIWLGLGARETGGHVYSIEYDPARAAEAKANIQKAGLTQTVTVIHGDAFKEIPKLGGSFDFVFLDAWKPDYKRFFELVFPRMTPGGVFTAHNVINKKNDMKPFLDTVQNHKGLFTTIVAPSGEGISISYKTR